jgi:serine acetyltransferase
VQVSVAAKAVVLKHVIDPSVISNYEGKSIKTDPLADTFGTFLYV